MSSPSGEIFDYAAPWLIYAMNWSNRAPFRLAIGSFVEEYTNTVQIVELDKNTSQFQKITEFAHPYPPTKIMWNPDTDVGGSDLLATTGDFLRLWQVNGTSVKEKHLFSTNVGSILIVIFIVV